jgi:homoserine acetyltransferase
MRALEWAVSMPDRVASLFFLASGAVAGLGIARRSTPAAT